MRPRPIWWWSSVSLAAVLLAGAAPAASPFSPAQATEPQPALLEVSVNGAPQGEPVLLLKGADGALYATEEAITSWRLKRGDAPAISHEGKTYYALSAIPGLSLNLIEATQILEVTAPPGMLEPTRIAYDAVDVGPMTPSGTGGFLNYDLLGQLADGETSLSGTVELGAFTPLGVGLSSFVGRWGAGETGVIRLDTNWTIDDPARMRSLRIGDAISRGGVGGGPLRFGGLQFARNFAVQPGYVILPMPSVAGSAAVPSVVDVYVNNALRDSREVPPGPFEITGVPVVTGGGDVQLIVRDLLGRETVVSQSYYAAPQLVRRGLHDYSFEIGFLRRNFARESMDYGPLFLATTQRYGLSDTLTGEVHVEATEEVQAGGVEANVLLPGIGLLDVSVAGSSSDSGEGALAAIGFERRTPSLSFGMLAEFTTDDYVAVGWLPGREAPAMILQAFAGMPFRFGSVGFSYLRRDGRGDPDIELLSANATLRVGPFGTLHLAGRTSLRGKRDSAVELLLIVPLGRRTSASGGAELRGGGVSVKADLQRNLPAGEGFGYRAAMALGAIDRLDGRLSLQTAFGTYDADLTWVGGSSGLRISAAGGIGAIGGHVFASRRLSQSFAMVDVGDYEGVRVYADNQLVGTSDSDGRVVIPRLRPYDRNVIRIEIADLPMDAEVANAERNVRPYDRSGVAVDFKARRSRAALLRVLLENGEPLPAGSAVRLEGGSEDFVSAPGGEVYLTGLGADNLARATWSAGSCQVRFRFEANGDPQPMLGDHRCVREGQ